MVSASCSWCGMYYEAYPCEFKGGRRKYCSKACMTQAMSGPDRMVTKDGYVVVRTHGHPRAQAGGFVFEHILVMENHLGRFVVSPEQVHHDNENRADNRIENLVLCKNNHEHTEIHRLKRLRNAGGDPDKHRWCSGCGPQLFEAFSSSTRGLCRACAYTYNKEMAHGSAANGC